VALNAPSFSPAHEAPPPTEPTTNSEPLPLEPSAAPSAGAEPPSAEQLHAALLATPIVMYTAPWCGACRRAHAFLQANGLVCKDLDVDANPTALRELKQRTGDTAIPVLEVEGKLLRAGFSERALERALVESVERRLGVRGIRLQTTSL
jgi:glutaredoxin